MIEKKLNIGAGNDIKEGWHNHDIAWLPGIDTVHDLNSYPWPFPKNHFEYILANDVLEHLDSIVQPFEELHSLLVTGGILELKVPHCNSWGAHADPTHRMLFNEFTVYFFVHGTQFETERPYYSSAKFQMLEEAFIIAPFSPYLPIFRSKLFEVSRPFFKKVVKIGASLFPNIILDLKYKLKKI